MALETGTYTFDLVTSNPVAGDSMGQADDHIRFLKSTIKNTFSNFTAAALTSTQAQIDAAVATTVGGTLTLQFKPGSAASPGITPLGDPDTGLWTPGANQISLAVGGVEKLTVASTGTTLGSGLVVSGPASAVGVVNTGAYSGGTGQLVPIGSSHLWHSASLPAEGGYAWANGGTLSRTTYPTLFALWGTTYGVGDGSTTFNVVNMCEIVPIGQRGMGGAASRGLVSTGSPGTVIGEALHTLTAAEIPTITSNNASQAISVNSTDALNVQGPATASVTTGGSSSFAFTNATRTIASTGNNAISVTSNNTSGSSHNNVQPCLSVNYIIRIG